MGLINVVKFDSLVNTKKIYSIIEKRNGGKNMIEFPLVGSIKGNCWNQLKPLINLENINVPLLYMLNCIRP